MVAPGPMLEMGEGALGTAAEAELRRVPAHAGDVRRLRRGVHDRMKRRIAWAAWGGGGACPGLSGRGAFPPGGIPDPDAVQLRIGETIGQAFTHNSLPPSQLFFPGPRCLRNRPRSENEKDPDIPNAKGIGLAPEGFRRRCTVTAAAFQDFSGGWASSSGRPHRDRHGPRRRRPPFRLL